MSNWTSQPKQPDSHKTVSGDLGVVQKESWSILCACIWLSPRIRGPLPLLPLCTERAPRGSRWRTLSPRSLLFLRDVPEIHGDIGNKEIKKIRLGKKRYGDLAVRP